MPWLGVDTQIVDTWPKNKQKKLSSKGRTRHVGKRLLIFFSRPSLFQVLRRTVIDRESQSALLLGYAGTGKSLVLDRVLRSLAQEALSEAARAAAAAAAGGGKRKRRKKDGSGVDGDGAQEGGAESRGPPAPLEEIASPPPPPRHQPEERQQRRRQEEQQKQPFRAVYLNGAAQADDGVAMREIVQQLGITGAASQGSIYNRLALGPVRDCSSSSRP